MPSKPETNSIKSVERLIAELIADEVTQSGKVITDYAVNSTKDLIEELEDGYGQLSQLYQISEAAKDSLTVHDFLQTQNIPANYTDILESMLLKEADQDAISDAIVFLAGRLADMKEEFEALPEGTAVAQDLYLGKINLLNSYLESFDNLDKDQNQTITNGEVIYQLYELDEAHSGFSALDLSHTKSSSNEVEI